MSSRCRCIERCISPCPHRSSSEREVAGVVPEEEEVPEYSVQVDGFEPARRGRHVIYSLTIRRGDAHWPIRRRFRQVAKLHEQLLLGFGRRCAERSRKARVFCGYRKYRNDILDEEWPAAAATEGDLQVVVLWSTRPALLADASREA
ncbi:unnamed protein product [Durusdinium trenchii]|uniref:PX domain-containing protein n=1 Tax=Durusdinium trenchii TaxID=1381693 RepID=A0ABP0JSU8_9DINO